MVAYRKDPPADGAGKQGELGSPAATTIDFGTLTLPERIEMIDDDIPVLSEPDGPGPVDDDHDGDGDDDDDPYYDAVEEDMVIDQP